MQGHVKRGANQVLNLGRQVRRSLRQVRSFTNKVGNEGEKMIVLEKHTLKVMPL